VSNNGKFYASNNPERYNDGPFNTVEEAIENFKIENNGEFPDYIGVGRDVYCTIDGKRLVEELSEGSLYDELYEDALNGWCNIPRSDKRWDVLSKRLNKVLHDWLDEVGEPKSWTVIEPINMDFKEFKKTMSEVIDINEKWIGTNLTRIECPKCGGNYVECEALAAHSEGE